MSPTGCCAMAAPTVDHRGPEFAGLARQVLAGSIPAIRAALDSARHPALLLVDTISSLRSVVCRHDEWGPDVTIWCSQKGMMLPPGLGMNAVSRKAHDASSRARLPRSYWAWQPVLAAAETGLFPYTPATNLLFGLREALAMLEEEGMPAVVAQHARHAEATRRAVRGWGLDIVCQDPDAYSSTLTAVMVPGTHDADRVRQLILERCRSAHRPRRRAGRARGSRACCVTEAIRRCCSRRVAPGCRG
jgi:alanine-glyoxylate transaminase / serine-glyoxylate transaminase / serine-pyruvate transaminase